MTGDLHITGLAYSLGTNMPDQGAPLSSESANLSKPSFVATITVRGKVCGTVLRVLFAFFVLLNLLREKGCLCGLGISEGCFSLTWLHYLWRLLSPFSLPCAQKRT